MLPALHLLSQPIKAYKIQKPVYFDVSGKLSEIEPIELGVIKRNWKERIIPNNFSYHEQFIKETEEGFTDPILQLFSLGSRENVEIDKNFAGVSNSYGVAPPDTDGDVSLNHYMQMVNNGFAIWDKEGTLLYGPADNSTLWEGFQGPWSSTNDGDPIVIYDEYEERWIASQFAMPYYPLGPYYELVAVSATSDPTGEWYRYAYEFSKMPDYPKFGVWNDGYYFTINQFANAANWAGGGICALNKEKMLVGDPGAEMVFFDMGYSYGSLLPSDADGTIQPSEESPAYFVNMGNNVLRVWEVEMDWENMENSTVTLIHNLSTQPFASNNISIEQPETDQRLSPLAGRLLFRLQYRNFIDYEVMVTNHTVNAGGGRAGVRWYELRKYDADWEIYQQGTYAPDDGENRWMGSVAMNQYGDIAVGYSVSSENTYPSIRFAGQSKENSGSGILDLPETSIFEGTKSQTGVNRWGDYAMMSVDPSDHQTFWFTTEYSNGGWNWRTQIASFRFSQFPNADFSADKLLIPVGETINFTDKSTGIPDEWQWTFVGADPTISSDQNPENITYPEEGLFTVRLIVQNEFGIDTIIKEDYIEVSATLLPEVDFEADKNLVCTDEVVQFTDFSLYSPIAWNWEFEPSSVTFVNGTNHTSQNPAVTFTADNDYSVTLTVSNLNGSSTLTKEMYIKAGGYQPFFKETFEETSSSRSQWIIENPDNDKTWEFFETGGTSPGSMAAGVNFSKYYAVGQRDRLISPILNLNGLNTAYITFQHSYATRIPGITDSLLVYISSDCGSSWTKIFAGGEDGSGNFATHEPTDYDFWPQFGSDWCMWGWGASCFDIDISNWAGMDNIKIAFETYSYHGNPIMIDNVIISQITGENELTFENEINIFPNPTRGTINIQLPEEHDFYELEVLNQYGKTIIRKKLNSHSKSVFLNESTSLSSGVYIIRLSGMNQQKLKKVVVN